MKEGKVRIKVRLTEEEKENLERNSALCGPVSYTHLSVHFLFSAACERWRHSRGSILPGWILGRTLCRRPHSVSSPYPGKSPLSASRPAAKPPSGTTYSRPRKKPSADRCRCPHRQERCSCRPHSSSTSGVSGWPPVSSAPVSCGKGNRPACVPAAASLYRGYLSCVPSILLSVAVLPEKVSCPISAACSQQGPPQSLLCGERRRSGASELSPFGGSE